MQAFLGALQRIGSTAPVRAEPFGHALRGLSADEACAAAARALRQVFAAAGVSAASPAGSQ